MKVVFLDYDGVLNGPYVDDGEGLDETTGFTTPRIHRHLVQRLNRLVRDPEVKVVLSTSWRTRFELHEHQELLAKHGFEGKIIDRTEKWVERFRCIRGMEIADWLQRHREVTKFVILDDDSDMAHLLPKLVQTDWRYGLSEADVDKAIAVLA